MRKLLTIIAIELPLVALIVFSSFGPSEWPTSLFFYVVAPIVIAPIMFAVADRLLRRRP